MADLHLTELAVSLAAILVAARLLGFCARRLGLPAVLGELFAGMLLGHSLLGLLPAADTPAYAVLRLLAELGVILLLFEVGLEIDLRQMLRSGAASLSVASVGVVVPFLLGFAYWRLVPHPLSGEAGDLQTVAIFVGATLTATSVGITARVLGDLGRLDAPESRIILGAAVIDDVLGIVILGIVTTMAGAVAGAGNAAASVPIIAAFVVGSLLGRGRHRDRIIVRVKPVVGIMAPIFFVTVGAAVDVRLLDPRMEGAGGFLMVAGTLTVLAVIGKVVAGWAAPWLQVDRLVIGVGMVPRGEVGLIFADTGRRAGLLSDAAFSAILLMVMATTFLAPVALKVLAGRKSA